jgi:hypothetical protein
MATTSQQQPQAQQQLQSQKTPYSSRPIKTAPAPPRADALREQRRNMFLRKVRQSRDDSKWDNRIEDVCFHSPLPFPSPCHVPTITDTKECLDGKTRLSL